jgi:hypothetical protein
MRRSIVLAAGLGVALAAVYAFQTADRTPAIHRLGGGATIGYDSFAVRASGFDGVAVVRVVDVGEPEWNTVDGAKPPEEALAEMLSGPPQYDYFIGRPVTLELVEMIRGTWFAPKATVWWKPGGQVGEDLLVIDDLGLPDVAAGQLAVAFTFDVPRTPTPGVSLYVAEVYPVSKDGRILTPLPDELIRLADLDSLVSAAPPQGD